MFVSLLNIKNHFSLKIVAINTFLFVVFPDLSFWPTRCISLGIVFLEQRDLHTNERVTCYC